MQSHDHWSIKMCTSEDGRVFKLTVERKIGCVRPDSNRHQRNTSAAVLDQHFCGPDHLHAEMEGLELVHMSCEQHVHSVYTFRHQHAITVPGLYTMLVICLGESCHGHRIQETSRYRIAHLRLNIIWAKPTSSEEGADHEEDSGIILALENLHHTSSLQPLCLPGDFTSQDGRWVARDILDLIPQNCSQHDGLCHALATLRYVSTNRRRTVDP